MTTSPDPNPATVGQAASPEVATAKVPVVLAEEMLSKQSFRVGTTSKRPGVALVYAKSDGSLTVLDRPLKFTEVLAGVYRRRYEVSLIDHEHEFSVARELPTLDDVSNFGARGLIAIGAQPSKY
jgi:hypothetical protein